MDEDGNPIIKNTGDINIDTTTYFQDNTQDINDNGEYIYEQNENGAWHLVLKPQGSTEPTDVNIDIPPPTITTPIENNGYYKFNGNNLINGTSSDYNLNVQVNSKINIKYYNNSTNSSPILLRNMIYNNTTTSVSIGNNRILIYINKTAVGWSIKSLVNKSGYNTSYSILGNSYYSILNILNDDEKVVYLFDENQNKICILYDGNATDGYESYMILYDRFFNLIFD